MALPVPSMTWQYSVNELWGNSGSSLASCRDLLLRAKNSMISVVSFTSPFTVWGSNNGAGAFGNNDGIDRWATTANLVWAAAGSNHSWIVLTQSGVNTKCAWCIDLSNVTPTSATIVFSPNAGFGAVNGGTDGTATARPTATDEQVLINNTAWGGPSTDTGGRLHVMISSNGRANRVFVTGPNNSVRMMWLLDRPQNPPAGTWSHPAMGLALGSSGSTVTEPGVCSIANLYTASNVKAQVDGVNTTMSMTAEGNGGSTLGSLIGEVDQLTLEWLVLQIGLYSATVGSRGQRGYVYDMRWTSTVRRSGEGYPADGTWTWAQFGNIAVPWNGSPLDLQ